MNFRSESRDEMSKPLLSRKLITTDHRANECFEMFMLSQCCKQLQGCYVFNPTRSKFSNIVETVWLRITKILRKRYISNLAFLQNENNFRDSQRHTMMRTRTQIPEPEPKAESYYDFTIKRTFF